MTEPVNGFETHLYTEKQDSGGNTLHNQYHTHMYTNTASGLQEKKNS